MNKLFLTFLICFINAQAFAIKSNRVNYSLNFQDYALIGSYKEDTSEASLEIRQKGKLVEKITDHLLNVNYLGFFQPNPDAIAKLYLILEAYSGGAHCCTTLRIYELGDKPLLKAQIEGFNYPVKIVKSKLNRLSFEKVDPSFAYWHTCFSDSAVVDIPLAFDSKGELTYLELSGNLNQKEIMDIAKNIHGNKELWKKHEFADEPLYPGAITKNVVKLLYHKQPELAKQFLEAAWNPSNPYKDNFIRDLSTLLNKNDYWQWLKQKGYKYFLYS